MAGSTEEKTVAPLTMLDHRSEKDELSYSFHSYLPIPGNKKRDKCDPGKNRVSALTWSCFTSWPAFPERQPVQAS